MAGASSLGIPPSPAWLCLRIALKNHFTRMLQDKRDCASDEAWGQGLDSIQKWSKEAVAEGLAALSEETSVKTLFKGAIADFARRCGLRPVEPRRRDLPAFYGAFMSNVAGHADVRSRRFFELGSAERDAVAEDALMLAMHGVTSSMSKHAAALEDSVSVTAAPPPPPPGRGSDEAGGSSAYEPASVSNSMRTLLAGTSAQQAEPSASGFSAAGETEFATSAASTRVIERASSTGAVERAPMRLRRKPSRSGGGSSAARKQRRSASSATATDRKAGSEKPPPPSAGKSVAAAGSGGGGDSEIRSVRVVME